VNVRRISKKRAEFGMYTMSGKRTSRAFPIEQQPSLCWVAWVYRDALVSELLDGLGLSAGAKATFGSEQQESGALLAQPVRKRQAKSAEEDTSGPLSSKTKFLKRPLQKCQAMQICKGEVNRDVQDEAL